MTNKEWLKLSLFFLAIILFDQLTKSIAPELSGKSLGLIHFSIHQNRGLVLGMFSGHSEFFRSVFLPTLGVLLFGLFIFIQFQLQPRILYFRFGIVAVMAGILGNVIDRIKFGYVVDFLYVRFYEYYSPVLNAADIFQWTGFIFILFSLFKYEIQMVPPLNIKKIFWLNKSFEMRLALFLSFFGMMICAVTCVFSYLFLKVEFSDLLGVGYFDIKDKLIFYAKVSVIMTLFFGVFLFVLGLFVAKKISGPIFAFERYVNKIIDDQPTSGRNDFRLRCNDELKNLEHLGNKVRVKITQKSIKKFCSQLYFKD